MSTHSELDIRWPIGLLFLALGAVLSVYGAVAPQATHLEGNVNFNLNLVWGVVMVCFGLFMAWGARRSSRRQDQGDVPSERTDRHAGVGH